MLTTPPRRTTPVYGYPGFEAGWARGLDGGPVVAVVDADGELHGYSPAELAIASDLPGAPGRYAEAILRTIGQR